MWMDGWDGMGLDLWMYLLYEHLTVLIMCDNVQDCVTDHHWRWTSRHYMGVDLALAAHWGCSLFHGSGDFSQKITAGRMMGIVIISSLAHLCQFCTFLSRLSYLSVICSRGWWRWWRWQMRLRSGYQWAVAVCSRWSSEGAVLTDWERWGSPVGSGRPAQLCCFNSILLHFPHQHLPNKGIPQQTHHIFL